MRDLDSFLKNLTTLPGVYSMLDAEGKVIYVGKAKNLKKRITSYFKRHLDNKTISLVKHIESIQITVTRNEREALLLEANLIKQLNPRYNVVFKDDKSYPYLYLSTEDSFPRLSFHRGARTAPGKYYGPYPSAGEAREALSFLQVIFKLRQCDNTFFKNRTRPCLQYQIKRCTAPCVGYIDQAAYQQDVKDTILFLEGKSDAVLEHLMQKMEAASLTQDYERAARIRDQTAVLRRIQEQQIIVGAKENVDVIGVSFEQEIACIHLLVIRQGRMLGSRHYFPKTRAVSDFVVTVQQELLEGFLMQHYLGHLTNGMSHLPEGQHKDNQIKVLEVEGQAADVSVIADSTEQKKKRGSSLPQTHALVDFPNEIIIPFKFDQSKLFEELFAEIAERKVEIKVPVRGKSLKWLEMASQSAEKALKSRLTQKVDLSPRFEALQEALGLPFIPERIECFDVSHTMGESTVASCVVFDVNGAVKNRYRRFNIKGLTPGDDYGALKQALTRHYTRLKSEGETLPDVLLIDGGKGQLSQAISVLHELQVTGVFLLGVAKGVERKPGLETLYRANGESLKLQSDSKALHLIQQVRDEAHRFAITTHRKQSRKTRMRSKLEDIPGVGKSRRLALLRRFGGLQEIKQATVEEIAKVPGVNLTLAERIYAALHGV